MMVAGSKGACARASWQLEICGLLRPLWHSISCSVRTEALRSEFVSVTFVNKGKDG